MNKLEVALQTIKCSLKGLCHPCAGPGSRPLMFTIYIYIYIVLKNCNGHFWKCISGLAYETSSSIKKMRWNTMFITAVCVIFLIKLRWPKNKSLYNRALITARFAQAELVVIIQVWMQCDLPRHARQLALIPNSVSWSLETPARLLRVTKTLASHLSPFPERLAVYF